ncbi:hypothetical protein D3C80_1754940 [compost metagenome]
MMAAVDPVEQWVERSEAQGKGRTLADSMLHKQDLPAGSAPAAEVFQYRQRTGIAAKG